jgi:hypothetical protein
MEGLRTEGLVYQDPSKAHRWHQTQASNCFSKQSHPAPSCDNTGVLSTRDGQQTCAQVCTVGWSHGRPLPGTHQSSRQPEGRPICTAHSDRLGTGAGLIREGWDSPLCPKSSCPEAGHGASLATRPLSQTCCAHSFLHSRW